MLFMSAALHLIAIDWHERERQELAALTSIRSSTRALIEQRNAEAMKATSRGSPREWVAALPSASLRQDRLADLMEIAIRHGLTPQRMEQSMSFDLASETERLRVDLPVSGSYKQHRRFVDATFRQYRRLSLDSVRIRRSSPQAATVEADLAWSMLAKRGPDQ